jgi:riboflavin synthase
MGYHPTTVFTGLIENAGTVVSLSRGEGAPRLTVRLPSSMAERLTDGASIAVNGVCLTALAISATHFSADLAAETLARTTLGNLAAGATVNLELPTPAGAPLGGHVVQGHVDGVGSLVSLTAISPAAPETSDWVLRVAVPQSLAAAIVPQGSITLDGISLTVAGLASTETGVEVRVAIIPHTYAVTHLHTLVPGAPINIETDVLAKYASRIAAQPEAHDLTLEYLLSNGY